MVILKKSYGGLNKEIIKTDYTFEQIILKEDVNNYDSLDGKIIIESIEDITYFTNPTNINNPNEWTQMLLFKIQNKSKENVLILARSLNDLEIVESAKPSYITRSVQRIFVKRPIDKDIEESDSFLDTNIINNETINLNNQVTNTGEQININGDFFINNDVNFVSSSVVLINDKTLFNNNNIILSSIKKKDNLEEMIEKDTL